MTACITYFDMGAWPVFVGFTASAKAFRKEMKRLKMKDGPDFLASDHANASAHYFTHQGKLTVIITIGSTKGRTNEQVAAMVAHEAVHVAQEMWRHLGEKNPGDEAEAYLVQLIVQSCLQEIWDSGMVRRTEPA